MRPVWTGVIAAITVVWVVGATVVLAEITNDRDVWSDRAQIAEARLSVSELATIEAERQITRSQLATVKAETTTLTCQTAATYLSQAGIYQARAAQEAKEMNFTEADELLEKADGRLKKAKPFVTDCTKWEPTEGGD